MRDDLSKDRAIQTSFGWLARDGPNPLFSLVYTPANEIFGSALILPPFGMQALDLFIPAFYTASAGVRALRFDGRNNVGLSKGDIYDFKLSVMLDDARVAADHLVRTSGRDDFLIYGMSLTASAALILANEYPRSRAVLFVPVVDICGAVKWGARDDDLFEPYRRGDSDAARARKIFGHDVHAQPFYDDLLETGLGTVEGVLDLARSVRGRVDLVLAGKDEMSSPEHRLRLTEALDAEGRFILLERATHDFGRSPVARKRAFGHLMQIAQLHFDVPIEARRGRPAETEMVALARMERAAVKAVADRLGIPTESPLGPKARAAA
ncbi:MAG: Methyltransferase type 11 [Alphaproteobacteria bacterium]|nr:Methyltransferase type 11 [Alphaproteobacteria bacterium]